MKLTRIKHIKSRKHQQGVTLIELLVAGVISLIAVSGMVLVMATTLGTTTQTIEMTRLTQEMRTAMQIMTRELRRANYHPGFIACYGNTACLADLGITAQIDRINIGDSVSVGDDDCMWFWYDRPQRCPNASCTAVQLAGAQTAVTAESVSAFRRAELGGVGRIQMTTTRTGAAACSSNADWVDITDPNIIDVTEFTVVNAESIAEAIGSAGATQNVEKIGLKIIAKLTEDASVPAWIKTNSNPERELDNFVNVRNNIVK